MFRKWSERKNIFTAGTVTINIPENYNCDLDLENVSGKIEIDGVEDFVPENGSADSSLSNDVVDALVELGYSKSEAISAVKRIDETEDMSVEDMLKKALMLIG